MANSSSLNSEDADQERLRRESQAIQDALRGLRFGSVNVIVQDGVVVQIDRLEKKRLVHKPPREDGR